MKILEKLFKKKKMIGGNPLTYNSMRIFFYYVGCPFCRMCYGVIERINTRLPPNKRISTLNIYEPDFRNDIIKPDAVPYLYLDGYVLKGVTTREYFEGFIKSFMKHQGDFIEEKRYY